MKQVKMKILSTITFLILMSTGLYCQDITGLWNGAIDVQGTQLHLIIHVIKTGDNQFKATMDSPDQNATGIAVTAINFNNPKLKLEISNIGAIYEGTLSDNRISGKWMQSGQSFLLILSKKENPG